LGSASSALLEATFMSRRQNYTYPNGFQEGVCVLDTTEDTGIVTVQGKGLSQFMSSQPLSSHILLRSASP
jgi:hypothetical protein